MPIDGERPERELELQKKETLKKVFEKIEELLLKGEEDKEVFEIVRFFQIDPKTKFGIVKSLPGAEEFSSGLRFMVTIEFDLSENEDSPFKEQIILYRFFEDGRVTRDDDFMNKPKPGASAEETLLSSIMMDSLVKNVEEPEVVRILDQIESLVRKDKEDSQ